MDRVFEVGLTLFWHWHLDVRTSSNYPMFSANRTRLWYTVSVIYILVLVVFKLTSPVAMYTSLFTLVVARLLVARIYWVGASEVKIFFADVRKHVVVESL